MNKKFDEIYENYKVLTPMDMMFNRDLNFLLTNEDLDNYKKFVDEKDGKIELNIKSFDSKSLFYINKKELVDIIDIYHSLLIDIERTGDIDAKSMEQEVINNLDSIKDKVLLKNMRNAYKFIIKKPKFNNNNYLKLFEILSKNRLDDKEVIYKTTQENINLGNIKTTFKSVPVEDSGEYMESLFNFLDTKSDDNLIELFKPFIAQFYIVYLNKFIKYNDELSRIVGFWLMINSNMTYPKSLTKPLKANKFMYSRTIQICRQMNNDITHFIKYILNIFIEDELSNKNINNINEMLLLSADHLTNSQIIYLKNILTNSSNSWFSWREYAKFSNINHSKQAILKTLNSLESNDILEAVYNEKKEKKFKVIQKFLKYQKRREF